MNLSHYSPEIPIEDAYSLAEAVEDSRTKERILSFARPFARMLPDDDKEVESTDSYVGGYPFIPAERDLEYPYSKTGRPLFFLCQINFSDLPDDIPRLPKSGLLQWFVEDDEFFGLSFDAGATGKEGLVVRWFSAEELASGSASSPYALAPESVRGQFDWDSPLLSVFPTAVKFRHEVGIPFPGDEINDLFLENDDDKALLGKEDGKDVYLSELLEEYGYPETPAQGDKVGGYPSLIQGDPRTDPHYSNKENAHLLIQLDSEFNTFTMWGDMGVANLFGNPAEVANGNLSSVRWNWTCH